MHVRALALTGIKKKVFVRKFLAFIVCARELNLVSKCGQMNKLYSRIIQFRGYYEEEEKKIL